MPTPDPPAGHGHEDRFAALEHALTRIVRRVFLPTAGEPSRREAGVDLEWATYTTLVRIADLDGARLTELAAALGLDLSTTSRHVKRLVAAGYVAVTPDPQDARARLVSPTETGRTALDRVGAARRRRLAIILADWEPAQVTLLAQGMERLIDDVEAADPVLDPEASAPSPPATEA